MLGSWRRKWLGPVAGLILLIAGALYLFLGDTGVRQAIRLRAVREHLPAMNGHLALNPKFSKVKAHLYTGQGGSMMLVGTVDTVDDYRNLISYTEKLRAPVTIVYRVTLPDGSRPVE